MEFDESQNNGNGGDDSQNASSVGGGGGSGGGGGGGSGNNSGPNNNPGNRERERDRRGRGERGTRFSDANEGGGGGGGGDRSRERRNCRIYVSNIPYDYRWQDLKDLFRRVVGSVEYVELFQDEFGKARGCGIVEFKDPENVQKALEKMNRYEINGREIVVKEDHGENRDQFGRIVREGVVNRPGPGGGGGGGGDRGGFRRDRDDDRISGRQMGGGGMGGSVGGGMMGLNDFDMPYNTYGLSTSFLESLGITGPLHNKVFVANLDYKVDSKKLKQVFKLAGKVQSVDLSVDKEGNSRGFAVIEYDHPVEAVQSISMFDRQMLFERRMTVRLDRIPDKGESIKLPEGLGGIGIGLGPNGEPLRDVARNLPNMGGGNSSQNAALGGGSGGMGAGNMNSGAAALSLANTLDNLLNQNNAPVPVAPPLNPSAANLLSQSGVLSSSNLTALSNALASNPLLSSSLSNLGLNLGGAGGSNVSVPPPESSNVAPAVNSYNTGSAFNSGYSSGGYNTGSGRQDFDPSVRSYNTQPQQNSGDYGSGNMSMFGSQNQPMGGGNLGVGQMGGGQMGGGQMGGGQMGGGQMGGGQMGGGQMGGGQMGGGQMGGGQMGGGQMGGGQMGGNQMGGGQMGGGQMGGGQMGGNQPGGTGRKSDTIVIKNIPLSCTWQTLRDKFRDIGEVKFAEIRGNDVGVVRFFKEKDAELAIKLMDGSRMEGRVVSVSFF